MESSEGVHDIETRENRNYAASYRPISLLQILSKVLEKILLKRLVPIIDEHQLISKY
jgi:hypothetical protein